MAWEQHAVSFRSWHVDVSATAASAGREARRVVGGPGVARPSSARAFQLLRKPDGRSHRTRCIAAGDGGEGWVQGDPGEFAVAGEVGGGLREGWMGEVGRVGMGT